MNDQKPIAASYSLDGAIDVHSMFKTIQGEGPFCGERALFIRLYGCNLRCPGCDTEYTATRHNMTPAELVNSVSAKDWPVGSLIVLTGGEPFRQNVFPAIYALITAGWHVQVETNGVLAPPGIEQLDHFTKFSIVCSPKTSAISPMIASRAIAFKYVLRAGEIADDGLPTIALGHAASPFVARPRPNAKVYVQPMDEQDNLLNLANTRAAIDSAMVHGHTLQIQIHKVIGLD